MATLGERITVNATLSDSRPIGHMGMTRGSKLSFEHTFIAEGGLKYIWKSARPVLFQNVVLTGTVTGTAKGGTVLSRCILKAVKDKQHV